MLEYILLGVIAFVAVAYLVIRYYKILTGKKGCCDNPSGCKCSLTGKPCDGNCSCGNNKVEKNDE